MLVILFILLRRSSKQAVNKTNIQYTFKTQINNIPIIFLSRVNARKNWLFGETNLWGGGC